MSTLDVFAAARQAGSKLALVIDGRELTYTELARGAARALGFLAEHGVSADAPRPVALLAEKNLATIELIHALIAIGAPIVLVHPKLGEAERRSVAGELPILEATGDGEPLPAPDRPLPADERPLAIVSTSGSTGQPRRVVLSRRAWAAAARASAELLGWRDGDRWLCCLPLAHVGGFAVLVRCLSARKTVLVSERWDSETTLASLVPTQLARWLEDPSLVVPHGLRAVLVGGAAASTELVARARERGIPVLPSYGMSETSGQIATARLDDGELGHVGPPLAGVEIRIQSGRIAVRGPTLASGLPLEDGFFVTDDLGRLDERGRLWVLGRASDRLISGGENVDPLEVERVLERARGVAGACVFGLADAEWGDRVAVAIVPAEGFDPGALAELVRSELAPFKRPRAYATLATLPLIGPGKLDRRAAAALALPHLREL